MSELGRVAEWVRSVRALLVCCAIGAKGRGQGRGAEGARWWSVAKKAVRALSIPRPPGSEAAPCRQTLAHRGLTFTATLARAGGSRDFPRG